MASLKTWISRGGLVLALGFSLSMVFHPDVKTAIRRPFEAEFRDVLSTAFAKGPLQKPFHIVKVKTRNSLVIEVYDPNNNMSLFEKIELPRHKDAYFTYQGQASNLVLDDIDGDGSQEILVPTLDSQFSAHLNIFKFDSQTNHLVALTPDDI